MQDDNEEESPLPFLRGVSSVMAEFIETLIIDGGVSEDLDKIVKSLPLSNQQAYTVWKASLVRKTPPLPFLHDVAPEMADFITGLIHDEGISEHVDKVIQHLTPATQTAYSVWKARQINNDSYAFLRGVSSEISSLIQNLIKHNDLDTVDVLIKRLSLPAQKGYKEWKDQQLLNDKQKKEVTTINQRQSNGARRAQSATRNSVPSQIKIDEEDIKLGSIRKSRSTESVNLSIHPKQSETMPNEPEVSESSSISDGSDEYEKSAAPVINPVEIIDVNVEIAPISRASSAMSSISIPNSSQSGNSVNGIEDKTSPTVVRSNSNISRASNISRRSTASIPVNYKFNFTGFPSVMNILLLGEHGNGKSTLINSIANYFTNESLDEAEHSGFQLMISSNPLQNDRENRNAPMDSPPTTQPKSYMLTYGNKRKPQMIRFIDTPGIGRDDSVEDDRDKMNAILSFISGYDELHAILLVLSPENSRLATSLDRFVNEFLVHLHVSACKNIIFVFTATQTIAYKPEDTSATLKKYLHDLQTKQHIRLPLKRETLFAFENKCIPFLCSRKRGVEYSKKEKQSFAFYWTRAVSETQRMFSQIAQLPPHRISKTLTLNNSRRLLLAMGSALGKLGDSHSQHMSRIAYKKKMTDYFLDLCAYVKCNSIIPYNEAYIDYVASLKHRNSWDQIDEYRIQCQAEIEIMKKVVSQSTSEVKNIQEIKKIIKELKGFAHFGRVADEINKVELLIRDDMAHPTTANVFATLVQSDDIQRL